jgi:hypothetical protein
MAMVGDPITPAGRTRLATAIKGIGASDNKLMQAHTKADHHNPTSPMPPDQAPPHCSV